MTSPRATARPLSLAGEGALPTAGVVGELSTALVDSPVGRPMPDGERAGQTAGAALLPFTMDGHRLGVRQQPPKAGEHTDAILAALGYGTGDIQELRAGRAVA